MGKEGRDRQGEENCVSVNSESQVETHSAAVDLKADRLIAKKVKFLFPELKKDGLFSH